MKYLLSLIICLTSISFPLYAEEMKLSELMDMFRASPAYVSGEISFNEPFDVYKDKKYLLNVKTRINANQRMGFTFSEQHIQVNPDKGMNVLIQGISVPVKQIYYDHVRGEFSVKTATPGGIGQKKLNQMIEKELKQKYQPKLIQAFQELTKLKANKNLQDAQLVAKTIANIFHDETIPKIPDFQGTINLGFDLEKGKKFDIGKLKAQLKPGEFVSAGISYNRTGNKIAYKDVEFKFSKGFEVSDPSKGPKEVASVNITSLKFDGSGEVDATYSVGAEDVLTGVKLVTSLLRTVAGHPLPASLAECDPVVLEGIRRKINQDMRIQISKEIKTNYPELIKAGVPADLLALFK